MVVSPSNSIRVHSVPLPPERPSEGKPSTKPNASSVEPLPPVESALEGREYMVGDFSAADVMLGHALFMANRLGQVSEDMPNGRGNVNRIAERPAFEIAINM
jgi:glutathione S-transferase